MQQKQIQGMQNFDNNPMYSNQQTIAHQPDKVIIDFKSTYPQFTPDNEPTLVVNHRIIMMDPYNAKSFLHILKDNIEKYEKKFGEIKKSKQLEKAEKEIKATLKQEVTGTEKPHYMG